MQAQTSFRQKRLAPDRLQPTRPPRGITALEHWRDSEGQSELNRGSHRNLSDPEVRSARQELAAQFRNSCIDIASYEGIDQGSEGACSLIALIHAVHLARRGAAFSQPFRVLRHGWQKWWQPEQCACSHSSAAADLGATIDMCISTGLLQNTSGLAYVPIRSEGNREQSFNDAFWTDVSDLATRFRVDSKSVTLIRHVYETTYLIESSLDRGWPIAINALEHSRVAVGYNETHLLFADSWGTNYTESNKLGTDRNVAGFSIVDKWLVFCWIRDAVIVEPH